MFTWYIISMDKRHVIPDILTTGINYISTNFYFLAQV